MEFEYNQCICYYMTRNPVFAPLLTGFYSSKRGTTTAPTILYLEKMRPNGAFDLYYNRGHRKRAGHLSGGGETDEGFRNKDRHYSSYSKF